MTDEQITAAVARAEAFLEATSYFAALGLEAASADARMCARAVLELADALAAERSARQAMQEARDLALRHELAGEPGPRDLEAACAA